MTRPASDHFDGRRFFNPTVAAPQPFTAVPRMLLEPRTPWPSSVDTPPQRPAARGDASAVITFIGHSTFLIQTAAGNLLTDPMYSTRAGPWNLFGPRRVRQPAVRFEDLPPIATVLLSHNHYDHCDLPTLRRLARRFDPLVVTPLGNAGLVRSAGIRRVEELDWWEHAAAMPIALTPARHFSARSPFDRDRALWGGFVVQAGAKRIFFAGDTAYATFFPDVRARLGPFDLRAAVVHAERAHEPR
jgi:L-ascorbate metabolism protein UlaG (beta-lactamase superfamily)